MRQSIKENKIPFWGTPFPAKTPCPDAPLFSIGVLAIMNASPS
jgi:hypothetical protein